MTPVPDRVKAIEAMIAVLASPPDRLRKWPHGYGYERPDEPMEAYGRRIAGEALDAALAALEAEGWDLTSTREAERGKAVAAWVRWEADSKDYAAACEWRNVADAIEREAEDKSWRCADCWCVNQDHEAFCYRCGAGQPEALSSVPVEEEDSNDG